MAEKTIKSRVLLKNDTKANWSQAEGFSPLAGEVIIYNDGNDNTNEKLIKIGDGQTNVNSLSFLYEPITEAEIATACNSVIPMASEVTF